MTVYVGTSGKRDKVELTLDHFIFDLLRRSQVFALNYCTSSIASLEPGSIAPLSLLCNRTVDYDNNDDNNNDDNNNDDNNHNNHSIDFNRDVIE